MGQRTGIILVQDVVRPEKTIRMVSVRYSQWGFGRPVVMDVMSALLAFDTGKMLTGSFGENVIDNSGKSLPLTHHNVTVSTEIDNLKLDTLPSLNLKDFISCFNCMDNNNGGAIVWNIIKDDLRKSFYCFLAGPEDDPTAFTSNCALLDEFAYLTIANACEITKIQKLFKQVVKYTGASLISDKKATTQKLIGA